jgi:hypothetical protein
MAETIQSLFHIQSAVLGSCSIAGDLDVRANINEVSLAFEGASCLPPPVGYQPLVGNVVIKRSDDTHNARLTVGTRGVAELDVMVAVTWDRPDPAGEPTRFSVYVDGALTALGSSQKVLFTHDWSAPASVDG